MSVEDEEARVPPGADLERYVRELAEFVGLGEADASAIRESAPAMLKHEAALTSALYEHFLRFPATARFFLAADGTPDRTRIERRKHSLARWLKETAEAALTHDFAYYLLWSASRTATESTARAARSRRSSWWPR